MLHVWDERKRLANLDKHGFDFADLEHEFDLLDATLVPSASNRLKAIGRFRGKVIVVVFAPLGAEALAIVSMRSASLRERATYGT